MFIIPYFKLFLMNKKDPVHFTPLGAPGNRIISANFNPILVSLINSVHQRNFSRENQFQYNSVYVPVQKTINRAQSTNNC